MNIIKHTSPPVQPTATYRVEERTIDTAAAPDNDGLMNPTLTASDVDTDPDRDSAWEAFRILVTNDPARYAPGAGRRLVLVKDGDR